MVSKKPVVVDLFSGAGGLSLGFELAGYNVAAHVELDKSCCETLRHNFKNSVVLQGDIEDINPLLLKKQLGEIDIVIGGPPCQGFSIVGKSKLKSLGRHLNDPRNKLYKQFLRFVYQLNPKAFVMENVPGILIHNRGLTAKRIMSHFEKLGYDVSTHLLSAKDYGVPQTRKRVFFVGTKDGYDFKLPENSTEYVTVSDAISDLPILHHGGGSEFMDYNKNAKTRYQQLIRGGAVGVFNHVARSCNKKDLKIFSLMKQGMKYFEIPDRLKRYRDDSFRDKYKRLVNSKPSWTVVAHLQKDGYMYIHPTQNRTITVREAARLQSFPDRFVFSGPMTQQFRQVGNAVPPLLAKAIALSLRNCFQKIEIPPRTRH